MTRRNWVGRTRRARTRLPGRWVDATRSFEPPYFRLNGPRVEQVACPTENLHASRGRHQWRSRRLGLATFPGACFGRRSRCALFPQKDCYQPCLPQASVHTAPATRSPRRTRKLESNSLAPSQQGKIVDEKLEHEDGTAAAVTPIHLCDLHASRKEPRARRSESMLRTKSFSKTAWN